MYVCVCVWSLGRMEGHSPLHRTLLLTEVVEAENSSRPIEVVVKGCGGEMWVDARRCVWETGCGDREFSVDKLGMWCP